MRKSQRGFSLVELLTVVTIILIVAAIAIPNYLRARIAANETSAVSSVRTINTAEVTYENTYFLYADDLAKLGPPPVGAPPSATTAGLIDPILGCAGQPCTKSGYIFLVAAPAGALEYTLTAVPASIGVTGHRGFCSSQLIIINFDINGGTSCTQVLK